MVGTEHWQSMIVFMFRREILELASSHWETLLTTMFFTDRECCLISFSWWQYSNLSFGYDRCCSIQGHNTWCMHKCARTYRLGIPYGLRWPSLQLMVVEYVFAQTTMRWNDFAPNLCTTYRVYVWRTYQDELGITIALDGANGNQPVLDRFQGPMMSVGVSAYASNARQVVYSNAGLASDFSQFTCLTTFVNLKEVGRRVCW